MIVDAFYSEKSLLILDPLLLPMLLSVVVLKDLPNIFPVVPPYLSAALILSKLASSRYKRLFVDEVHIVFTVCSLCNT